MLHLLIDDLSVCFRAVSMIVFRCLQWYHICFKHFPFSKFAIKKKCWFTNRKRIIKTDSHLSYLLIIVSLMCLRVNRFPVCFCVAVHLAMVKTWNWWVLNEYHSVESGWFIEQWIEIYLPFLIVVAVNEAVVFDNVSIIDGIGIDPEPSFTARLSNLIDSVVAINNTFCEREKKISPIKLLFWNGSEELKIFMRFMFFFSAFSSLRFDLSYAICKVTR